MVTPDQYHNRQEMLLHVMNLHPIHLFVVVMGHSQPKFIIKNKSDSRKSLEGATNEENRISLL
jgi:hypothetical protein